jgi:putative salt-induced outer membrane protein YdiY
VSHSIRRSMFCLFVSCLPGLAADRVVLSNGDTITGAIVKKDGARLFIKSEFLGEISMPWSAVKSIQSDSELVVALAGGELVKGKVSTSGDTLQVVTGTGTKSAPMAGVTAVRDAAEQHSWERLQHPRLLELWTGNLDMGLALARGNARTTSLTNAFTAARITTNDKIAVYFNQIYGSARLNGVTSETASAVRGGWLYNRQVSPRLFVTTLNDYEHDRFQNLDLRFVMGGGFGWNALKSEKAHFDLSAGVDYNRENFDTNVHRNSAEVNYGDNLLYKISGATAITQAFRVFNNLSNSGAYRLNFDLGSVTTLKKWLGWQLTASDRFLSNPVVGRQRNDLLISTGFRVTFAK